MRFYFLISLKNTHNEDCFLKVPFFEEDFTKYSHAIKVYDVRDRNLMPNSLFMKALKHAFNKNGISILKYKAKNEGDSYFISTLE